MCTYTLTNAIMRLNAAVCHVGGAGADVGRAASAEDIPLLSVPEIERHRGSMSQRELSVHAQRIGLRMGALTTLVRCASRWAMA